MKVMLMPKPLQKIRQNFSEIAAARRASKVENAFAKKLEPTLKIVARMRMEKMLQKIYPEMEDKKRKQLSEKFSKKTRVMRDYATGKEMAVKGAMVAAEASLAVSMLQDLNNPVYYVAGLASAVAAGVTGGLLKDDLRKRTDNEGVHGNVNKYGNKVRIRNNDSNIMISTIDHEAVHFLNNELKLRHPKGAEELIATTISASLSEPTSYETLPMVDHLGSVKHLSEIPLSVRKDKAIFKEGKLYPFKAMAYAFEKPAYVMSEILDRKLGEDAKNRFIRMTMEGYNPIHSFNEIFEKNGVKDLKAVVENGKVKIRQKDKEFDCS